MGREGGRAEPQRHTGGDRVLADALRDVQSPRLYLQGGQHLTKQSAGKLLEGTLQTFLMLAQISPHREQIWHELCEQFVSQMRRAINSIKRGNTEDQMVGQQPTHPTKFVCLNQLGCQLLSFEFLFFSSFCNPVSQARLCIKGNLQHIRLMLSSLKTFVWNPSFRVGVCRTRSHQREREL